MLPLASDQQRLLWFARVLAASMLLCLCFSWKLWLSRSMFPMVPVLGFVPPFPKPLDVLFLCSLIGALVGVLIRPSSKGWSTAVVICLAVLFLQDQNRLWPSFYQFFLLFLLLLGHRRAPGATDSAGTLAGMRFVLAAIYFWGGVHKLNTHFFHEEFPWFIEPLTGAPAGQISWLPAVGVAAAIMEMLMGVGLLTRRFRLAALGAATMMHVLIFFCIGPLRDNWNNSSWIWGQTMALQLWTLFWAAPPFQFKAMLQGSLRCRLAPTIVLLLVGICPVLNGFNLWDSALSFNVYSGNVNYAEVHLKHSSASRLPPELLEFVSVPADYAVLNIQEWTLSEFNANPYPETRIFLAVLAKVCSYLPNDSAQLVLREKSSWLRPASIRRYDCSGRPQ